MQVEEAARQAGVTVTTIYRWIEAGRFPATKGRKTWEIDPMTFTEFLAQKDYQSNYGIANVLEILPNLSTRELFKLELAVESLLNEREAEPCAS